MLKQRILNDACVNHKIIAFRTEKEEWGETIIGHVEEVSSRHITIDEIDEYGIPIGTTTFNTDALINIVIEDKTLKCLELLEKKNKQLTKKSCTTFWGNGHDLKGYIYDRLNDGKLITIFVEDDDTDDTNVIGFVREMDEQSVLVEMIDRYGEIDGKILIPLETIIGIRWESQEDKARCLLRQSRWKE